ncbi:MAG TPA: hypothetical protein VGE02_16680 [Gemmatimonadales bacterium]
MSSIRVGLCATCRHVRLAGNRRGSTFYRCARSESDPRFPKYPPLPVLRCIGYEREDAEPVDRSDARVQH